MNDDVELALPAKPELLSLARLTVAAVASRADFDYEEIEDLRLAIDELCSPLVGHNGRPGKLCLRYSWGGSELEVSCMVVDNGDGHDEVVAPDENELSDRILDALVDEHGSDLHPDGGRRVWLRKRRHGGTA